MDGLNKETMELIAREEGFESAEEMYEKYRKDEEKAKKMVKRHDEMFGKEKKTVILKEEKEPSNKWGWVKQYKDTPLSIIRNEGDESYSVALGNNLITERRWKNETEVERWLDEPTRNGYFPWKEVIVLGIITKK